ncbi:hypothetical protein OLEAN_C08840 [Oleispira antarctica RB-8]|uniref:Uncharacterized protein n=1 Tax=Oleispira antarctica RB-8 TaxID=698738 RepID=R4YL02_OLEAN|nr:hypothetical protein OLEAN_C08840 [Oleispira antarctica RB-8]
MFDLCALHNKVETIAVSPWQQGTFNGSKQNQNFWLSPTEAQGSLVDQLSSIDWKSCVLIIATGKDAQALNDNLKTILVVFPNNDLEKFQRHAEALAEHETKKMFIAGIKTDDRKKQALEKLSVFSSLLFEKQDAAVKEAADSDQEPAAMLTAFKDKCTARLDEIAANVAAIIKPTGIENAIHLSGGDISNKVKKLTMPNENAPLCCLLALGGSAADLAPLIEAMAL